VCRVANTTLTFILRPDALLCAVEDVCATRGAAASPERTPAAPIPFAQLAKKERRE